MNPLLFEYIKRQNSTNVPTARGARELLLASIHEAGHWLAFAHYRVPVTCAIEDRGSKSGSGIVQLPDLTCLVPEEMKAEVNYVAVLAGPAAACELIPFDDMGNIRATSKGDERIVKDLFAHQFGDNREAKKSFREKWVPFTENLVRQKWSVVEALAYELMVTGRIMYGMVGVVERRYGIGRHDFTQARLKSAQVKLAEFHSSPDELLRALLATS